MKNSSILLDTHSWIWVCLGHEKMAKSASRKAIEKAFREHQLAVSAISLWEVAMLEAKGRLALTQPCQDWLEQAVAKMQIEVVPLSVDIAVESSRLPGGFHGDSADRLIVATARKNRYTLVTQDSLILSYGKQGLVNTMACF